jgi:hypothetical protein
VHCRMFSSNPKLDPSSVAPILKAEIPPDFATSFREDKESVENSLT